MTTVTLTPTSTDRVQNIAASTYAGARAGTSGTLYTRTFEQLVGQIKSSATDWSIKQGFLTYDLSSIPSNAVISDAYFQVLVRAYGADWASSGEVVDFQFKAHGHPVSTADFLTGDPLTSQDATLSAADVNSGVGPFNATSINVVAKVAAAIGESVVDVVVTSHKQSTNAAPSGAETFDTTSVSLIVVYAIPPVEGAASLGATATLTAAAEVTRQGAASLLATASLAATALRSVLGAAAMSGTASLNADGNTGIQFGATSLQGSASLAATGQRVQSGAASMVANAALAAAGILSREGAASLSGSAALAASGQTSINPRIMGPPAGQATYQPRPPAGTSFRSSGPR